MTRPCASTGTGSRILDELAEVIGERAALDLAWAFKGIMLYVPKDPAVEPKIAEAIGTEAANRLCDTFYRMTIYMPFTEVLKRKVLALDADGDPRWTKKAIALELGIQERRVYRIIERATEYGQADERQPSFF